jgi:2-keto-myo-inositol isomerase
MLAALSEYTLVTTPKEKFIESAEKAGFPAIEFSWKTVVEVIQKDEVSDLARMVKAHNLTVCSINGPDSISPIPENEFEKLLLESKNVAAAARTLECDLLVPSACPVKDTLPTDVIMNQAVEFVDGLAETCGEDIRIGYEFVGLKSFNIKDLKTAQELVRRVGRRNVGIVVDTFHMYLQNTPFSEVAKMEKQELFLVHVNDSKPGATETLTDADRVYPGQGVMRLGELRSSLNNIGYRGFICLELFNRAYWKDDPEVVAKLSRKSLSDAFGA